MTILFGAVQGVQAMKSQDDGKPNHTDKTWRLIAYIRELASLGCGGVQTARMLGVSPSLVGVLACKHSISMSIHRSESPLRRAIRAGYAANKSFDEIAYETGKSANSVRVIACKMGLTATATRDPAKNRRGFAIPANRMAEYKELRKLGMTIKECGVEMGLLKRPHVRSSLPSASTPVPAEAVL